MVDKFILYLMSLILFLIGLIAMGLGGVSPWSIVMTGDLPRGMGLFVAVYLMTAFLMDMVYYHLVPRNRRPNAGEEALRTTRHPDLG